MRLSIAIDTARGLLYLHTAIPGQPLVHRDVKRSVCVFFLVVCLFVCFHLKPIHTSSCVCVVFLFVYSANILLDLAYRAKVGDFGLARCLGGTESKGPTGGSRLYQGKEEIRTLNIVGTSGYIPKEYLHGIITPKMDVYAFGVVSS